MEKQVIQEQLKDLSLKFMELVAKYNDEVSNGTAMALGSYTTDSRPIVVASITCSLMSRDIPGSTLTDKVYPATLSYSVGHMSSAPQNKRLAQTAVLLDMEIDMNDTREEQLAKLAQNWQDRTNLLY